MKREKVYPFTREGLSQCMAHRDYIEKIKDILEDHPELFPYILGLSIALAVVIISPAASTVAYKSMVYDNSIIAFKYLGGF